MSDEDAFSCWPEDEKDSARRRVYAVVAAWSDTFYQAQIATRGDLASWLNARLRIHYERFNTWPKRTTMLGWAREYARSAGFHGSNARKAGERQAPLREIPVALIADEDALEAVRAQRERLLHYAVRRAGRTTDDWDEPELN